MGIDPNRVGVLGFSAGGHLAAAIGNHFERRLYGLVDAADNLSCRPNFSVLVYPAYLALAEQNFTLNPEVLPITQTPPTFIVQTEDDPVHVENAVVYFLATEKFQGGGGVARVRSRRAWLRPAPDSFACHRVAPSSGKPGYTRSRCCQGNDQIQLQQVNAELNALYDASAINRSRSLGEMG